MTQQTLKQQLEGCKYFNGLMYETCVAGVRYADVARDIEGKRHWPCIAIHGLQRGMIDTCEQRTLKTAEEIATEEAEIQRGISEYTDRLAAFTSGKDQRCPSCGTPVTNAVLYAKMLPEMFSLYVKPCGCRLGLWTKAPDWITNVEIIDPYDEEYSE